jgi:scyllo-inositol 2-dehydrogenase (NADP+)
LEKIRTGIVGYGISSRVFHTPFISTNKHYDLVAFVERSKEESKELFPNAIIYRSIDEMIADPSIELVVITTPNETHFPYAAAALKAGKHVVLEKPFAISVGEATELVDIYKQSGKVLSVYQNRRYVSDFLTIRDLLSRQLLGDLHEFEAHYDRYRPEARPNAWREAIRPGSGILFDLGPHLIDQALILFGMPSEITADIRMQRPHSKVDDYFDIWLNYGFLKVKLHAGMLVREMGPRYMLQGTEGSFIKYGEDPQEALLRLGQLPLGENWGMEDERFNGILHTNINGQVTRTTVPTKPGNYGLFYENLYQTIRNQAPLQETPEHGLNTIRIIELAIQSSNEKRTLVV